MKLYCLMFFLCCLSLHLQTYAEVVTSYKYDKGGYMTSRTSTTKAFDDDGDGVSNVDERARGTDPDDPDSDDDNLSDGWEIANGFDPLVYNAADDDDFDGRTNIEEFIAGTTPNNGINLNLVLKNVTLEDRRKRDYRASNLIQIAPSFVMKSGTDVSLSAGETIVFQPGFVLMKGATLYAGVK